MKKEHTDRQNKVITKILKANPGLKAEDKIFIAMHNKTPKTNLHGNVETRTLEKGLPNGTNSVAIRTDKCNYICIDFDGYSRKTKDTKEYKQEKTETAKRLKDSFIELLHQETINYRVDKTASSKFHVWVKHPKFQTTSDAFKLDGVLTKDGIVIDEIVEIFSKYDKHNVHLAGSSIANNDGSVGVYTNVYAGASFDKLDSVNNLKALIHSAITNAGYLLRIKNCEKVTNTKKYQYLDTNHNGIIKEFHKKDKLYFSYVENDKMISHDFYVVKKDDFTIEHISNNCEKEFQSILMSIYYYNEQADTTAPGTSTESAPYNEQIIDALVKVYKKYWSNTESKRHYLILATSNILANDLGFNDGDLDLFFDKLSDNVEISNEHRYTIREGKKRNSYKTGYGIPKIIDILGCSREDLKFLAKDNTNINNEFKHMEKIKPAVNDEIANGEKLFQKMQQLQEKGYFDGVNRSITIKPTRSITELIAQVLGNHLLDEQSNIAKLLLAFVSVITGNTRSYIIITGISGGGKSELVKTVKKVIPSRYVKTINDSSDKAFIRFVENEGIRAYDRKIIDLGDKGDIKSFYKNSERMGTYQALISDGFYNYQVTNTDAKGNAKGVIDITIYADGFAQIITTTKDVLAEFDAQKISRSFILNISDNTPKQIADFNADPKRSIIDKQISKYCNLFKSHLLYNLSVYNDMNAIISECWISYIKDLELANGGKDREIKSSMGAFKSFCWLEIERMHQLKGNDDKIYYIPSSDLLNEFIALYGTNTSVLNDIDMELIEWLSKHYLLMDDPIVDDESDLNIQRQRKDSNFFTYHDIQTRLKSDKKALYDKIDSVSSVLRKLEKYNILGRLADNTNKGNVIYYLHNKKTNKIKTVAISDEHINQAMEYLKVCQVDGENDADDVDVSVENLDDINDFFDDNPKLFTNVNFEFLDQRNKPAVIVGNSNDDNDDDVVMPGEKTPKASTIIAPVTSNESANVTIDEVIPGETIPAPAPKTAPKVATASASVTVDDKQTTKQVVNLHCHTDESVGDGAITIEKLIDTAIKYEQKAIALTNHGTLNGLYKFNKICKEKGVKAILGIEAYISEQRYHLILLAKNYKGYQDLLKLHNKNVEYMKSRGFKRNDKYVNGGIYYSNLEQDKELLSNIICLSGCLSGEIPTLLLNGEYERAKNLAIKYNTLFNQFYLELQYNGLKEQAILNELLIELSNDTGIPLTVTGDVHYINNKDDWNAIKYAHRKGSKAPSSINSFMTKAPKQFANSTIDIADSVASYDIETSLHIPKPKHKRTWLKTYCYNKLKELGIDDKEHRKRLEKELTVIKDEIADYHILLYEIVDAIKNVAGAIGGRGSAVGSLVCYCLGFHEVDPLKYNLLFERYLNKERIQKALESDSIDTSLLPDIDLNIADDKRDAVFKTLEKEYEHIAKVMTYSKLKTDNKTIRKLLSLYPTSDVIDLKYNLSVHPGGVILSTESFNKYLPLTLTKDNEIVTDCDLSEVEIRGGIKYDLLGESSSKINIGVTLNDDEIDELVAYTVKHPLGISQFTGYTARKYLREHNIQTFNDLLEATALIRTGANDSWIFQEDMMQQATKYGVSYADADYIRKPRGTPKEKQEKLDKIIETMKRNGCTQNDAELFKNYHNNYSFNKSHAVAYTLESLKNAKLKRDNTAKFFELKLNHVKDPITIAELFDDAIGLGVEIVPPNKKYYKLDAKASGNKLNVGTKFIKGISTKEPLTNGKFNRTYKAYLNKLYDDKLYSIGAYNVAKLPNDNKVISLGYKTIPGDKVIVATISANGLSNMWFNKSKKYKPANVFDKGAIISDDFIKEYGN